MYTDLGGFVDRGRLDDCSVAMMRRLSERNIWFVPVSTVLDHLLARPPDPVLTDRDRCQLERRFLYYEIRFGSA